MKNIGLLISAGLFLLYYLQNKRTENVDDGDNGDPIIKDPTRDYEHRNEYPDGLKFTPIINVKDVKNYNCAGLGLVDFENMNEYPIYIYAAEADFMLFNHPAIYPDADRPEIGRVGTWYTIPARGSKIVKIGGYGWFRSLAKADTDKIKSAVTLPGAIKKDWARTDLTFWWDTEKNTDWTSREELHRWTSQNLISKVQSTNI